MEVEGFFAACFITCDGAGPFVYRKPFSLLQHVPLGGEEFSESLMDLELAVVVLITQATPCHRRRKH